MWGAKQAGNKDGTEVGIPGYSELTHGHQQGLGIRTSLGGKCGWGHDAGGCLRLGWGWASAPGSAGEMLSSGTSARAGDRARSH